jgi:hypothetical protein
MLGWNTARPSHLPTAASGFPVGLSVCKVGEFDSRSHFGCWGFGCLVGSWLVCCVGTGRRVSALDLFWGTADRLGVGASSAVTGSELRSMFWSLTTGRDIVLIFGDVAGVAGDCAAESWVANSDEAQVVFLGLA